jgi:hypothetical protein
MQIQHNANRPVSPRDQAQASGARLPSSACRGQLGPAPLAGLFLLFDPLPIALRARADLNRSQYSLRSIDAAKLVHGAGIKIRVAHLLHAI